MQTTVSAAHAAVSLTVPKGFVRTSAPSPMPGVVRTEFKNSSRRSGIVVGIGSAGGRTVSSEMANLLGSEPSPISRQDSSPHVDGAAHTQLAILHFGGSFGPVESYNLVATTNSGQLLEIGMIKLSSDHSFDPMSVINSIKLSSS